MSGRSLALREPMDLGQLHEAVRRELAAKQRGAPARPVTVPAFVAGLAARARIACWRCERDADVVGFTGPYEGEPGRLYLACDGHYPGMGGNYYVPLHGEGSLCADLPRWLMHLAPKTSGRLPLLLAWLATDEAWAVLAESDA